MLSVTRSVCKFRNYVLGLWTTRGRRRRIEYIVLFTVKRSCRITTGNTVRRNIHENRSFQSGQSGTKICDVSTVAIAGPSQN